MVYKCFRSKKVNYYCHICLNLIAKGIDDKICIGKNTDLICLTHHFWIICPHCNHYEQFEKNGFGYYFKGGKIIEMENLKKLKK